MADVKWIKITTDIFDDEKMALIDGMPEHDAIIVIWFKLLCMAGRQNNGGVFMLNDKIAYTDEMLATIFRRPLNIVRLALQTFEQLGMVDISNKVYTIPNWEKHQSLGKIEEAQKKNRERVAAHRAKQKLLTQCNDYSNVTVMPCNAIEEDIDKERELERDIKNISTPDLQSVVDLYHSICISFPKIRSLSDARKKALKARLKSYTLEDFKTVFENAEASSFLKGTEGGWKASFDWLIKEANMLKVMEGNYADKGKRYTRTETKPNWMQPSMTLGNAELEAIQAVLAEDDPAVQSEAEQLKQRMQEKYGKGAAT